MIVFLLACLTSAPGPELPRQTEVLAFENHVLVGGQPVSLEQQLDGDAHVETAEDASVILLLGNGHLVRLDGGVDVRVDDLALQRSSARAELLEDQLAHLMEPTEYVGLRERITGVQARVSASREIRDGAADEGAAPARSSKYGGGEAIPPSTQVTRPRPRPAPRQEDDTLTTESTTEIKQKREPTLAAWVCVVRWHKARGLPNPDSVTVADSYFQLADGSSIRGCNQHLPQAFEGTVLRNPRR